MLKVKKANNFYNSMNFYTTRIKNTTTKLSDVLLLIILIIYINIYQRTIKNIIIPTKT